ncbi:MarR family winged helix-turn-helix transcriptional regulator [Catenuloplanes japonicus]|uniref:MarR family winged helix-turn-helix transcriptional regulator n=1 Tax=Catenuloplanes japonicus TaxID=33876 RepID=UPI0005262220|nr:MarR family transcriptional regulator [Catenuloplanes japonicus]
MSQSGAELARLLLGGYRKLVDAAIAEMAARGYEEVRPVHEFTMRAIAAGATTTSEVARRMSVSKQAAAKTIAVLQERGYVTSAADPADPRRNRIEVTERGFAMMREGEAIFDDLRAEWERQIGAPALALLESQLTAFVGDSGIRLQEPGWAAQAAG